MWISYSYFVGGIKTRCLNFIFIFCSLYIGYIFSRGLNDTFEN